jgi:hypothetical protein
MLGMDHGLGVRELRIENEVLQVQVDYFIYLFEKDDVTVSTITPSFEEGLQEVLEIRLQEYDTPVTTAEARLIAINLVSSWKAGTLSKDMLIRIMRTEKKIK